MRQLTSVATLVLLVATPGWAYVDGTPTLGRLLQDATQVAVLQVEKVSQEKRVIIYRKVADLKGRLDLAQKKGTVPLKQGDSPLFLKHRITDGLHSREPKTILDWAEPGKVAICFVSGNVAQICLGRYWYECAALGPVPALGRGLETSPSAGARPSAGPRPSAEWWSMTRGRPELVLAYCGPIANLRRQIPVMLSGKEATITAVVHGVTGWRGYEAIAFRQPLSGKEVPLARIRASLRMPGTESELMSDPHSLISLEAGDTADVPGLLRELEDKGPAVRAEAAEELGLLGTPAKAAAPALAKALGDPDRRVRLRAAGALLRLEAHPAKAPGAGAGLQTTPLRVLVEGTRDPDRANRQAAVEIIGKMGADAKEAMPALLSALKDSEPRVRWAAIEAVGSVGPSSPSAAAAVPSLQEALNHPATRQIAADSLGRLEQAAKPAVPALVALCKNADPNLRLSAATALIRIEADEPENDAIRAAVPVFVDGLRNRAGAWSGDQPQRADQPQRLWQAVWCFKWLGQRAKSATPALQALTTDQEPGVRAAALEALGAIGPAAKVAAGSIRQRLKDPDGEVRVMAAEALWRIEKDLGAALSVCRAALQDPSSHVRLGSAQVLEAMGREARPAAGALLAALADKERSVRWAAASALESLELGGDKLVPELVQALRNEDAHVRGRVAKILGKIGSPAHAALPALRKLQQDESPEVREAAAAAVKQIGVK